MQNRLLTLVIFIMMLSFAFPAWAMDNWQAELKEPAQKVWFWGDKQFAVVKNGSVHKLYVKEPGSDWSSNMIRINDTYTYDLQSEVLGVSLSPDKMYMVVAQDEELKVLSSTDGLKWVDVIMDFPDKFDKAWLTPVGSNRLLAHTDKGIMVGYDEGVASWDYQITSLCAPWDNVTVAGDKIFAVIDNQLKVTSDLRTWKESGFKISKTNIDYYNYDEIGGKAVPSIDFQKDKTVVAFNPGAPGAMAISQNAGENWVVLDKNKFINLGRTPLRITAVAVAKDVIFAGTLDNCVFYSTDCGQTWRPAEIDGKVVDLAIKDNVVLAATTKGVQRLDWEPVENKEPVVDGPQEPAEQNPDEPEQVKNIKFVLGQKQYTVGNETFQMDIAPLSKDGRIYLPVRYLALSLGVSAEGIKWEDPVVTLIKGNVTVKLNVHSNLIQVNDKLVVGNQPLIKNGRTLLPARWVAEAFGYTVNWDAQNNAMNILSN